MTDETHIPVGWSESTLGKIGEYFNGRAFKKSEWTTSGRPIIRIQNLTGTATGTNFFDGQVDEKHLVRRGDLLVSWAATLGAHIWDGPEACVNQHIFKVVSDFDNRFLYYLFQSVLDDLKRQTHGGGIVHITRGRFDSTTVLLPPEPERPVMVSKIEELYSDLDAGVGSLERAKANLRRYRLSVLKAAVEGKVTEEWREKNTDEDPASVLLDRILEERRGQWELAQDHKRMTSGGRAKKNKYSEAVTDLDNDLPTLPTTWIWATLDALTHYTVDYRGKTPPNADDGIRIISAANVKNGKIVFRKPRFVSEETYSKWIVRGLPDSGDLILTTEAPVAEVALLPEGGPFLLTRRVFACQTNLVDNRYLLFAMQGGAANQHIRSKLRGTTVPRILKPDLLATPIALPPLREQLAIIDFVDAELTKADVTVETTIDSGKRAQRLRQAILKRAFEGKLVPRCNGDSPAGVLSE